MSFGRAFRALFLVTCAAARLNAPRSVLRDRVVLRKSRGGGRVSDDGKASLATTSMLLFKNNVGFTALTLAQTCGASGLGASACVLLLVVACGAHTFEVMGAAFSEAAREGRPTDLESVWNFHGLPCGWVVDCGLIAYSVVCLLCYVPFLASTLAPLLRGLAQTAPSAAPSGLAGWRACASTLAASRAGLKTCVCLLVFVPLSFLRSFAGAMSLVGGAGNCAALYFVAFSALRYLDGSYALGGRFFQDASTTTFKGGGPPRLLDLASRCAFAISTHYNAATYHAQLRDPTPARFSTMVRCAYAAVACFLMAVLSFGALTFGAAARAPILENYADGDPLATLARWLYVVVSVSMYPLVFSAAGSRLAAKQKKWGWTQPYSLAVVLPLNLIIYALAMRFDDVGQLASLVGALFVPLFVWIAPGALALAMANTRPQARRWCLDGLFVPYGLAMMVKGLRGALA